MKKLLLFAFLYTSLFLSCKTEGKEFYEIWEKEKKIDFTKNYFENEKLINEIREDYKRKQQNNENEWECGYIQECQFLVGLYSRNMLEEKDLLVKINEVYDRFLLKNPLNSKNSFSFAILLYLNGNRTESQKILKKIYISKYEYNTDKVLNADIKNIVAGILLGEFDVNDLKNTIYENVIDLSEKRLIEVFLQTSI